MPQNLSSRRSLLFERLETRRLLAAGDLATGFGSGGLATFVLDTEASSQGILDLVVTDTGLIYAAAFSLSGDGSSRDDYILRLTDDGQLDSAFSGDGVLLLANDADSAPIVDLALTPDDNLLVARNTGTGGDVIRVLAGGTVDEGFAGDGSLELGYAPQIAIDGDVFLAAGNPAGSRDAAVVEIFTFNNGQPTVDETLDLFARDPELLDFDVVDLQFAPDDETGTDFYLLGDVRQVDFSLGPSGKPPRSTLLAFEADGDASSSFGGGEAFVSFGSTDVFSSVGLNFDNEGEPVVSIGEDDAINRIVRYGDDGSVNLNRDFRFEGPVDFGTLNELQFAGVDAGGNLVLAGYSGDASDGGTNAAAARILPSGIGDPDFDTGGDGFGDEVGSRLYDLGSDGDVVTAATFDDNGDLLVAGRRTDFFAEINDAFIAKIDLGSTPPPPPPGPDFATVDNNTLVITGTIDDDTITVDLENADLVVRLNGNAMSFSFGSVNAIEVTADAGNDSVTIDSVLSTPTTLRGDEGDDTLTSAQGDDLILGGSGDDSIDGQRGNDDLRGNDGNDTLLGGLGQDVLEGDAGNDLLDGEGGDDDERGGDGNDTLLASGGDDFLDGGDGIDVADYSNRDDAVILRPGLDQASGSAGEDDRLATDIEIFLGGDGNDLIDLANVDGATALGNFGRDTLIGSPGDDTLDGGDLDDVLRPSGGRDLYLGGDGQDTLDLASLDDGITLDLTDTGDNFTTEIGTGRVEGIDLVIGTDKADTFTAANTTVELQGGGGDDTFRIESVGPVTLVGGNGFDTVDFSALPSLDLTSNSDLQVRSDVESLIGTSGDDVIDMSSATGPMTLRGGLGNDRLIGGDFDDVLFGGEGDDTLIAGAGNDRLYGLTGNDVLEGGDGRDSLRSGEGADLLDGGDDNDLLLPGNSSDENDTVSGGDGGDIVHFRESNQNISISRGEQVLSTSTLVEDDVEVALGGDGDDSIAGFLRAEGGPGNDLLIGLANGGSALLGGDGDDTLSGTGDTGNFLDGGPGDDDLTSGEADDTLAAGQGSDTLVDTGGVNDLTFQNADGPVELDLRDTDNVLTSGTFGSISGLFANVLGSRFGDALIGDDNRNWLGGLDGDDTLVGNAFPDVLVGGDGADSLIGGGGPDLFLAADEDEDTIIFDGNRTDVGLFDDDDNRTGLVRRAADMDDLERLLDL
jgi:Ca2+-binding RTX toxin-like protein